MCCNVYVYLCHHRSYNAGKLILILYIKVILVSHVYATVSGENTNEIKKSFKSVNGVLSIIKQLITVRKIS